MADGSRLENNGKISVDFASNSEKLGGKAPEYYIQPRNLLDNSDFRNPVNQRGNTTYTGDMYTIDRYSVWGMNGDAGITLTTVGITFNPGTGGGTFTQKLPLGVLDSTKTYTLAVRKTTGETEVKTDGVTFNYEGVCDLVTISAVNETIVWAALYEGSYTADTLPPYVPKGYAAELAECRRYAKRITGALAGIAHGYESGKAYATIFTSGPKMRIGPSVDDYSKIAIINGEYYSDGFTPITGIASIVTREDSITFWIESSEISAGKDYYISCEKGVLFSADL